MTSPAPASPAAAGWSYALVPASCRDWLRAAAEQARALAYRTACDMIRVGGLLRGARKRVKRRTFRAWCEAELPWSRSHCYRLMAVADLFGPLVEPAAAERIVPTALYLLARPEVPPAARNYAVELSAERVVTATDAREILAAHRRTPDPDKAGVREYERRVKLVRKDEDARDREAGRGRGGVPPEAAWAALEKLVASATVVHVGTIAEEQGEDDPLYSITVHAEDDRPRNFVRRGLADAVLAAAGREPEKLCPSCNETKPAGQFGRNKSMPGDGKARCCKVCERGRLAAHKARKKAAKGADA